MSEFKRIKNTWIIEESRKGAECSSSVFYGSKNEAIQEIKFMFSCLSDFDKKESLFVLCAPAEGVIEIDEKGNYGFFKKWESKAAEIYEDALWCVFTYDLDDFNREKEEEEIKERQSLTKKMLAYFFRNDDSAKSERLQFAERVHDLDDSYFWNIDLTNNAEVDIVIKEKLFDMLGNDDIKSDVEYFIPQEIRWSQAFNKEGV